MEEIAFVIMKGNFNNINNNYNEQRDFNNNGNGQFGFNNNEGYQNINSGYSSNTGYNGGNNNYQGNYAYQEYPIQPQDYNNVPYNINQYPNPNK